MPDAQQTFHVGDAGSNPAGDANDIVEESGEALSRKNSESAQYQTKKLQVMGAQGFSARQPALRINLVRQPLHSDARPKLELDGRVRARFELRVQRAGALDCWLWDGTPRGGYGCFYIGKRPFQAHRISWALANGRWPDDSLLVMHSCDEGMCCNPAHLSLGTALQNVADCASKGRLNRERGEFHGRAKLNDIQVAEVLRLAGFGVRAATIASDFGITTGYVRALISGTGRERARKVAEQIAAGGSATFVDGVPS